VDLGVSFGSRSQSSRVRYRMLSRLRLLCSAEASLQIRQIYLLTSDVSGKVSAILQNINV